MLLAVVEDRMSRTNSQINLAVNVRLSFLMTPLGSTTQSAPSPYKKMCWAINLLVVSPSPKLS